MATISAGNSTDPWKLMSEYVRNMHQSKLANNRSEDLADTRNFQREMADRKPGDAYSTARATGQAGIDTSLAAAEAGLDPYGGRGRSSSGGNSRGPVNSKNAGEFARGLGDGGITSPIAVASLLGNSQVESAGFNPNALGDPDKNTGKMTAYGMMQWREDRQDRLRQFARMEKADVADPYIQGKFAAWELTQGPERASGQRLLAAQNLQDAQLAVNGYLRMKNYDKGTGAMHYSQRMNAAAFWGGKNGTLGPKESRDIRNANSQAAQPTVLTDDKGRRYTPVYPNQKYIDDFALTTDPIKKKAAGRYVLDPEMPPGKTGQMGYRYYIDPDTPTPVAPPAAGTTPPATGMVTNHVAAPPAPPPAPVAPSGGFVGSAAASTLPMDPQIQDQMLPGVGDEEDDDED